MSIQYCHHCHKLIDTDLEAEHFDSTDEFECIEEEAEAENYDAFDHYDNSIM